MNLLIIKELCRIPSEKKIKIPKKEWTWDRESFKGGYRYQGVHTYEGNLLWFTETYPAYAGGGASSQSFADFLLNGPSMNDVPKEVLDEILEFLTPFAEEILKEELK